MIIADGDRKKRYTLYVNVEILDSPRMVENYQKKALIQENISNTYLYKDCLWNNKSGGLFMTVTKYKPVSIPEPLLDDVKDHVKKSNYRNPTEFIVESVRLRLQKLKE